MSKKKSKKTFTICGQQVLPGERKKIELISTNLFTNTSMSIPVHVIRGKESGPCLLVLAAIHGDELNGVEIVRKLIASTKIRKLKGTLIAVPVMNIFGFIQLSRYLPDRRDLNRSFPGTTTGSLASRLAHVMTNELVSKCTHIIDLHTGAKHRFNLPQIRADLKDPDTLAIAKAFAAPAAIHATIRDGSLRSTGARRKIPTLVFEAGEALRLDKFSISVGVKGIINVMRYIEMIPIPSSAKPPRKTVIAHSMQWVRAPQSGMFHATKKLGSLVERNEIIGNITDPLGHKSSHVYANDPGIIIGQLKLPLVTEGDALFNIAYFDELHKASKAIRGYDEMLLID